MTALEPGDRPDATQVAASLRSLAAGVDAAEVTSALRTATLTMPREEPTVYDAVARFRLAGRRRAPLLAGAVGLVVLLVFVVVVSLAGGGRDGSGRVDVPSSVPAEIRDDLQDLHDAVNR